MAGQRRLGQRYGEGLVNSTTLFNRLIAIDTLLAFNGIIPSLADFQLKLASLLEQFNGALIAENISPEESEALCRLLCGYLDNRIAYCQRSYASAWQRYSLMHTFYGHVDEDHQPLAGQLKPLLSSEESNMFQYAWRMLTLVVQLEGQSEELISLRAACHARYYADARPVVRVTADGGVLTAADPESAPQLIVLIIGPFAQKWFNQADHMLTGNGRILWIVAPSVTALGNRLARHLESRSSIDIITCFPLLADGVSNGAVLIEQISEWQFGLSATLLPDALPCILVCYTRLSEERHSHDPERAIWTGDLCLNWRSGITLEQQLAQLSQQLAVNDSGKDLYAIQRHALGDTLLAWLAESRVLAALQQLFEATPLRLAGVTLADHGLGFTRHGAWSGWLAERYSILPGLSAAISLPPLPAIALPPAKPALLPASLVPCALRVRRRWPLAAVAVVVLAAAAGILNLREHHHDSAVLASLGPASRWLPGLQPAGQQSLITLTDTVPLFETGSSRLTEGSHQRLNDIAREISLSPEQMFLIVGHSDSSGTAKVNLALSAERAQVIRDWLVAHSSLTASHFIVEGVGDTRPIASNETSTGRALNRRVEIISLIKQDARN